MAEKFKVTKPTKLLEFLFITLSGWSKKKIKQRLQNSTVTVNGIVTTKHDYPLTQGDIVQIDALERTIVTHTLHSHQKFEILYQDQELIAINKPAGLLSVATTKETQQHALALLRKQVSTKKQSIKLWPVHRLDKETSGVLLFATSKQMREAVMSQWDVSEKVYLAVVEGIPQKTKQTITQPLRLDEKIYRMHVGKHPDAKPAITHYEVKKTHDKTSLLEIAIETGRQHQIRAHMAWLGHCIVGDERYGTKGERMGLHAMRLSTIHPKTKQKIDFKVDAPRAFYALLQ